MLNALRITCTIIVAACMVLLPSIEMRDDATIQQILMVYVPLVVLLFGGLFGLKHL